MTVLPLLVAQIAPRIMMQATETPSLRGQIGRYWMRYHRRIRRFAHISDRHADLVTAFPAAAFAIVCLPPTGGLRQQANRLILAGAPLAEIAALLGLPMWFRRLPPEAFSQPLPSPVPAVACNAALGARLLNSMPHPQTGARTDRWLTTVLEALQTGDEDLAVWLGSQRIFTSRRCPAIPLLPFALYVSFSRRPEAEASRYIGRPWDPKMGLGRAALCARQWLIRLLQDRCINLDASTSLFDRVHIADGLEFVPLMSAKSLLEEGVAMSHCVATYASYVAHGECKIYSLRRVGQRVATMEVRIGETSGRPRVTQIKGPHNAPVTREVWDAATVWLTARLREPHSSEAFRTGPHELCAEVGDGVKG